MFKRIPPFDPSSKCSHCGREYTFHQSCYNFLTMHGCKSYPPHIHQKCVICSEELISLAPEPIKSELYKRHPKKSNIIYSRVPQKTYIGDSLIHG